MQVQVKPLVTPYLIEIVEENTERVSQRMDEIWASKKGEIEFKGFRKGKIPRSLAEKKIGVNELYSELLDEIFDDAIKSSQHEVVGVREYAVAQFDKNKPVMLNAIVDIKPRVHNLEYKNVEVEVESIKVDKTEIDATIQQMLDAMAEDQIVERSAKKKDVVIIDFVGTIDGNLFPGSEAKGFELELGSNLLIPGFEDQLIGTNKNDKRTVTVTFPDNYHNTALAKKEAVFEVTVHEVKERSRPQLTDNFAVDLGYDNLKDMRSKLEEDLRYDKKSQRVALIENLALTRLVEDTKIDPIPEIMIKRQLNNILQQQMRARNTTEEKVLEQFGGRQKFEGLFSRQVVNDVKVRLILENIVDQENIVIDQQEVDQLIEDEAKKAKLSMEEMRKRLNIEAVNKQLGLKKALSIVVDKVKIKSKAQTTKTKSKKGKTK